MHRVTRNRALAFDRTIRIAVKSSVTAKWRKKSCEIVPVTSRWKDPVLVCLREIPAGQS